MRAQSKVIRFLIQWVKVLVGYWDRYEIKQDRHYSHLFLYKLKAYKEGRHMLFKAKFTESCLYDVRDDDINKLYGFTDANSGVHDNSVRFGWRHNGKGYIEIFAYWYNDNKRGWKKLGDTIPEQIDTYEIWARDTQYYFRFNDNIHIVYREFGFKHGLRLRLYPYFGGNRPAPNDIIIYIHEIK